jgi:DNA-binding IscR family transcriptional regulator
VRRTTLKDVIEIFEPENNSEGNAEPGAQTEFGAALTVVFDEIDDIARATLDSITLETMLKLTHRIQKREQRQDVA